MLIHWYQYPDSYDSIVSPSEVGLNSFPGILEPPSLKQWYVSHHWIEDSDKFNEWMNEEDYEMIMTNEGHWIEALPTNNLMKRTLSMAIGGGGGVANIPEESDSMESVKRDRTKRKRSASPSPGDTIKKRKRGTVTRRVKPIQDEDEDLTKDLPAPPPVPHVEEAPPTVNETEGMPPTLLLELPPTVQSSAGSSVAPPTDPPPPNAVNNEPMETEQSLPPLSTTATTTTDTSSSSQPPLASNGVIGEEIKGGGREEQEKRILTTQEEMPGEDSAVRQVNKIIIPSYSSWFDYNSIHAIEKRSLPEFFNGRNKSKTPETYLAYRNFMVDSFRLNPTEYLSTTACRRNLAGDVGSILRIHGLLEQWGIINYGVEPSHSIGPPSTGHFNVMVDTPAGIQPVIAINKPTNKYPNVWWECSMGVS
ncbi:PREDICTED: SWI/SNF complex subunit SMARCC2-like, partial [Amphimedon queenslandica]|uniref:SWIRM domain-containing protein n=2 Tax=Amphimedon queenslandica TaxID=400682 RepID=A0AAN0JZ90_AMPQE